MRIETGIDIVHVLLFYLKHKGYFRQMVNFKIITVLRVSYSRSLL